MTAALLAARVRIFGRLPWIATLCGFVVLGADLTGFCVGPDGQVGFRLEPPGRWSEVVEGRWFPTGSGGRSWATRDPPLPTGQLGSETRPEIRTEASRGDTTVQP